MARCLVTGGAGFIGSHVAAHLVKAGSDVVVLDDLSGGFRRNVPDGVAAMVEGSVCDVELVDALFDEWQFEQVFHLAAYAADGLSHFIRRFNYENNLLGSVALINAAVRHGVQRFVFTSSMAVYGSGQVPMREDQTPMPEDPYGIAKWAVEQDLAAAHEMFGLEFTVFRPHNVYGEGQNIVDRYRNVVGIFMRQVMQGEPMTVFGDGEQTRAFSHVDQVAPLVAAAPWIEATANETFNVGADEPVTINDLAVLVAEAFGVEPRVVHLEPRAEVRHAFCDHTKVRGVYGEIPRVELREGIARMAEWVREVGVGEPSRFGAIEITQGLPAAWVE